MNANTRVHAYVCTTAGEKEAFQSERRSGRMARGSGKERGVRVKGQTERYMLYIVTNNMRAIQIGLCLGEALHPRKSKTLLEDRPFLRRRR